MTFDFSLVQKCITGIQISTAVLCKNLKSKPGTVDNLMKIHSDRQFAVDVFEATMDDLQTTGQFEVGCCYNSLYAATEHIACFHF